MPGLPQSLRHIKCGLNCGVYQHNIFFKTNKVGICLYSLLQEAHHLRP